MKRVAYILIAGLLLLLAYNVFLLCFPLRWKGFHLNGDRIEAFLYNKQPYPVVIAGSSLSLAFDGKELFQEPWFNLCIMGSCSSTGVEIIQRTKKIPKKLFIEINRMDRGTDSIMVDDMLNTPLYQPKYYLPALLKKNKLLPNLIDRTKKGTYTRVDDHQPPPALFNRLIGEAKLRWSILPDSSFWQHQMDMLRHSLQYLSANGCEIYFFEVPVDSSLTNSRLLCFERNYFQNLAAQNGYHFIKTDTSRAYHTTDGMHLIEQDTWLYAQYFRKEVEAIP